jgi:hypothetical protein
MDTDSSFLEMKQPRREKAYSHPSRTEVKNACKYTSTLPYGFMTWCLIEDKDFIVTGFVAMKNTVFRDEAPCILVDAY